MTTSLPLKILAIEAATESCSVALQNDGQVIARAQLAPREHAALLLPMVQEVLEAAGLALTELDALAFGRGPGSFTGVRIATGVAQGLAYAASLPVLPVSTLAALAQGAWRELQATRVAAAIDARMNEVYWGWFQLQDGVMQPLGAEGVYPPEQVPLPQEVRTEIDAGISAGGIGYGSGWQEHAAALEQVTGICRYDGERYPLAEDLLPLAAAAWRRGAAVPAVAAQPVYLRDRVVNR